MNELREILYIIFWSLLISLTSVTVNKRTSQVYSSIFRFIACVGAMTYMLTW
jgi:hypothetical protein